MISSGLTGLDAAGNVQPALAESWETSDSGKTWTFKLKPEIFWQDGKKLVSADVSYQFSDATVTYPDDQTITFTLQSAYSAFPSVVARPVFRKGLLGTGEWKVDDLSLVGDFIDHLALEKENGERAVYKFYPTEERTKLAFQLGEVDVVKDLLDPSPLVDWKGIKTEKTVNKGEYVAVFLNTDDNLLADKSLRQALDYATRKDNLGGTRAISPIPSTSWAYNSTVKPYLYDAEKARSMINVMSAEVKNNLNIKLTTSPILLPQAELIQKDWQEVGVKVEIQVMSNIPNEYQALLAIFDVPDDPDQYTLWHSTQTQTNITRYSNPRIDKLLEDGRTTVNISQRRQIYLDFQRFLLEDAPAIFLYYPNNYTFSR
jgi:peptide/nickel transport system substrate-binding protein